MIDPIQIMKEAYASNYFGSISELILQQEAIAMQEANAAGVDVAVTPEQQQIGLTQGPPRTMAFPNTGGQDFNTIGMNYPVEMKGVDSEGGLVRSYEAVPPGIERIPMGPKVDTVIENPTQYQQGGLSFSDKIARYKASKNAKR